MNETAFASRSPTRSNAWRKAAAQDVIARTGKEH
jgi:hypothetical protein